MNVSRTFFRFSLTLFMKMLKHKKHFCDNFLTIDFTSEKFVNFFSLQQTLNVRMPGKAENGKEINEMFNTYKTSRIMPQRFVVNRND